MKRSRKLDEKERRLYALALHVHTRNLRALEKKRRPLVDQKASLERQITALDARAQASQNVLNADLALLAAACGVPVGGDKVRLVEGLDGVLEAFEWDEDDEPVMEPAPKITDEVARARERLRGAKKVEAPKVEYAAAPVVAAEAKNGSPSPS